MDPAQKLNEDLDAAMLDGFGSEDSGQSGAGGESAEKPPGSQEQPQGAAELPAGQQGAQAAPAADQNPGAEPQVDPFAELPEAVRNLLAKVPELEARAATADERSRRAEGQVRSFQSQLAKLTTQAPAAAPPAPLSKLEQARQTVGLDMPEVMEALDELRGLIPSEPTQQATAPSPAPAVQASAAEPAVDPVAQAHFEALDLTHPGWFETLESTDAKLWLATHPDMAAQFAVADTAKKLSVVLDGFKAHRQQTQTAQSATQNRQTRMAAAVLPQGGNRAPARAEPSSEEDGMAAGFNS